MVTFKPISIKKCFVDNPKISFVASMKANYNDLVRLFGEPHLNVSRPDRTNFEWYIGDDEGNCYTIYDWSGAERLPPSKRSMKDAQFVRWNIGGSSYKLARKLIAWLKINNAYVEEVGNWADQCVREEFTIGPTTITPILNEIGNIQKWEIRDTATHQLLKQYELKERAREFAEKWSRMTLSERQKIMHGSYKPVIG